MKKSVYFFIVAFLLFLVGPVYAQEPVVDWGAEALAEVGAVSTELVTANQYPYVITQLNADFELREDGTMQITENILADFFEAKHGIFRYVPTNYSDGRGFQYKLKIKLQSVSDKKLVPYNIAEQDMTDPFYLKIGSAETTLTGLHLYKIIYSVKNGVKFFDDHDEVYWNVVGDGWDTVVGGSVATIHLPEEVSPEGLKYMCYTGVTGVTESACKIRLPDSRTVQFTMLEQTLPGENFTIALSLPKGVIAEPTVGERVVAWLTDNYLVFLPIIVFIIMFFVWRRYGRELPETRAIIPEYEPLPELTPLIAERLLRDRATLQGRGLPAEIVNLAVGGYLQITEIPKTWALGSNDFEISKLRDIDESVRLATKRIFSKLFHERTMVKLSELKNDFYKSIRDIQEALKKETAHYYSVTPEIKALFLAGAIIVILAGPYLMSETGRLDLLFGVSLSGVVAFVFGQLISKKTQAGMDLLWHVRGLKMFVDVTEKDRAKFNEAQNIFETMLPYAMVFGLTEKWVTAFKDLGISQPNWYHSATPFNMIMFSSMLTNFETNSSKSMTSSPRSGGSGFSGGFSGGGFGGGGGGSW